MCAGSLSDGLNPDFLQVTAMVAVGEEREGGFAGPWTLKPEWP